MDPNTIDQALDDAIRLMALGYDAEQCTERWPAQRHELQPLLRVAQDLFACAEESDEYLRAAAEKNGVIDWAALLSDVPQSAAKSTSSAKPAAAGSEEAATHGFWRERSTKPQRSRTQRH